MNLDEHLAGMHPIVAIELRAELVKMEAELLGLLMETVGRYFWLEPLRADDVDRVPRCCLHNRRGPDARRRFPPPEASAVLVELFGQRQRRRALCPNHAKWVDGKGKRGAWESWLPEVPRE